MHRTLARTLVAGVVAALSLTLVPTDSRAQAPSPAAPRSNQVLEKRVIGTSVKGRPIVAYRKGNPDAKRKVVLLGSMHGDERAGVRTARFVIDHVAVSTAADVWIIPTMNPDGLARNTRTNAHGVDLNRNWPMNWRKGPHGRKYPGRRPASEPETRAMMAFLSEVQPEFLTSIHQPFAAVGLYRDKPRPFQRRLARQLKLPLRSIPINGSGSSHVSPEEAKHLQPHGGDNDPTLTGWYNAHFPGTAMTVEFSAHPSRKYVTKRAGFGVMKASLAR